MWLESVVWYVSEKYAYRVLHRGNFPLGVRGVEVARIFFVWFFFYIFGMKIHLDCICN